MAHLFALFNERPGRIVPTITLIWDATGPAFHASTAARPVMSMSYVATCGVWLLLRRSGDTLGAGLALAIDCSRAVTRPFVTRPFARAPSRGSAA
jgi:hypothetical protein